MKISLIFFVISVLAVLTFSQQSPLTEKDLIKSKIVDVPSADYRFTVSEDGLVFCNLTRIRIKKFRPGCVESQDGKLVVLSEQEFEESEIPAATKSRHACKIKTVSHQLLPYSNCERGKLAITEVVLANGKTWKLVPLK